MMKHKWITSFCTVIIIFLSVGIAFISSRPTGNMLYESINIKPLSLSEQSKIDTHTSFEITCAYRIRNAELKNMLHLSPNLNNYTLEGQGKHWILNPNTALQQDTVYKIDVINPDTQLEIKSFLFQTKRDLSIISSVPFKNESFVSLHSNIVFTFNSHDVDIKNYFEILPKTDGTFKIYNRTTTFIPSDPLIPNCIYRITLKSGLKSPDGSPLKNNYTLFFETEPKLLTDKSDSKNNDKV